MKKTLRWAITAGLRSRSPQQVSGRSAGAPAVWAVWAPTPPGSTPRTERFGRALVVSPSQRGRGSPKNSDVTHEKSPNSWDFTDLSYKKRFHMIFRT